ncbi:MAG: SH3 domain-containing protein, partial [Shimia sp.]
MRFLLVLLFWPAMVTGQQLPALFDVTGVRADDVLNIRTEPTARAPIIGSFAPDETAIEVLERSPSGTWGRVRYGEQMGWSSLRFLERRPG